MNKEKAQQIVDLISEIAKFYALLYNTNTDTIGKHCEKEILEKQQQLVTLLTEEK